MLLAHGAPYWEDEQHRLFGGCVGRVPICDCLTRCVCSDIVRLFQVTVHGCPGGKTALP